MESEVPTKEALMNFYIRGVGTTKLRSLPKTKNMAM